MCQAPPERPGGDHLQASWQEPGRLSSAAPFTWGPSLHPADQRLRLECRISATLNARP